MTYLPIDRNRIKISLSREEALWLFGKDFSSLQNKPKAGYILKSLLKKAVKDMGYRPKKGEIIARAVRNRRGGIDVYFSGLKRSNKEKCDCYILEFSNVGQLAEVARAVMFSLPEFGECGKLYLMEGKYRLLLPCLCAPMELHSLVCEFLGTLYTDRCLKAVTEEYGTLILPDKAVRLISKL